jgi:thiamine biosynthesis lipoprotein
MNIFFKFTKAVFILLLFFILRTSIIYSQDSGVLFELNAKKYLMGTEFEITAYHTSIDSCKKGMYYALKEVERIEKVTSNYKDSTEISYVNRNAADNPVKVSDELFGLIKRSIYFSEKYDGLFDITVGPLTNYWGFNSDHPLQTEPDKRIIDSLLQYVNYKFIQIDTVNKTIFYLKKGVNIDLGGIAKGYALDKAVEVLKNKGINNFLISGGGDIYVNGLKGDGKKWVVGIKNPRENEELLASLEITGICIATSGDYERFHIINGKRYHHIFNPRDGFPPSITQSSSVIFKNCEEGVVLSKCFFIQGAERINLIKDFESIPYFMVDGTGKIFYGNNITDYNLITIEK